MNISDQKKIFIEELLFQELISAQEYYLIGRILRRLEDILKNDDAWIIKNVPAHKETLLQLKLNPEFENELKSQALTLLSNFGKSEPRLPRRCAEIYYRILECCKNSRSNYEWFREYVKSGGRLKKRLNEFNVTLYFELPMVPLEPQEDTAWARILKKNMLMSLATFMPDVPVFKAHNGRTLKIQMDSRENNNDFFEQAERLSKSDTLNSDYDYTSIINLFLASPYQKPVDLDPLEYELNIPKKFK